MHDHGDDADLNDPKYIKEIKKSVAQYSSRYSSFQEEIMVDGKIDKGALLDDVVDGDSLKEDDAPKS